jgi:hypothetical protein
MVGASVGFAVGFEVGSSVGATVGLDVGSTVTGASVAVGSSAAGTLVGTSPPTGAVVASSRVVCNSQVVLVQTILKSFSPVPPPHPAIISVKEQSRPPLFVQFSSAARWVSLRDCICKAQIGQPFPFCHPSRCTSLQQVTKCPSLAAAQRGVQSSSSHFPACPGTRPRRSS